MTSNEHYGKLNARFEERSAHLRKIGYKYTRVEEYNITFFTCKKFGKVESIAVGTVMSADPLVWADTLERATRFVS